MITLGTGRLSQDEQGSLGLVGEHDYAVLDLENHAEGRRMLLKNPWFDGLVWTGAGSLVSRGSEAPREHGLTGIFWMTVEDVAQNFESMYLNWNPALFKDRRDHHFSWRLPGPTVALTLAHNPQYGFRTSKDGSVWVLLSRHFQDEELTIARRRSMSSSSMANVSSRLGFIRLYLFDKSDGRRVLLPDEAVQRGPYVDSPQTLLRLEAKANTNYTVVVGQEGLPLPEYTFSLSFFSRGPLSAHEAPERLPYTAETAGAWTRRTCGGNSSSPSYFDNPQYRVSCTKPTPLTLLLSTADPDLPIHIALVWGQGRRVISLSSRDLVSTSGEYRRSVALCRAAGAIDAGDYTAIVSTFDRGQLADFTLRVSGECPIELEPVLADGAGRSRAVLPTLTFGTDSEQQQEQQQRHQQPRAARAALGIGRLTKIAISATTISRSSSRTAAVGSSAVRISLETGQGVHRRVLATTGLDVGSAADGHHEPEFLDAAMGLRTPEITVHGDLARRSGGVWIVAEILGRQGAGQGFRVEVFSDSPVEVGDWAFLDDDRR
jgi:calpain-7